MHSCLTGWAGNLVAADVGAWAYNVWMFTKVLIGFSIIIFVHELGHFLAAKWVGIRVDRFAVGFGYRLIGWRNGEGLTFGNRPNYSAEELTEKQYGETDYCFKAFPLGGYVKMLGQDDIVIDDKTGEVQMSDDPRAFTNRSVGQRMIVASAGVVFNLLFAALLLMCVFLLGKEMESPVVGEVAPDSRVAGKIQVGDRIVSVNGHHVDSARDLVVATVLADGPMRLGVERRGKLLDKEIVVEPEMDEERRLLTLGITPLVTTKLARDQQVLPGRSAFRKDDTITRVNGVEVQSALDISNIFASSHGRALDVTAERPVSRDKNAPMEVTHLTQRARLLVEPADPPSDREVAFTDNCHILGMQRRRVVGRCDRGTPAAEAGFLPGDVIAEWGTVASPLYEEILESIAENDGKRIRVLVERAGDTKELFVVPRRAFKLFGESVPKVGIAFSPYGEELRPVVARVSPGTAAAALNMPRGSLIVDVDDQPVADWFEVVEALMAAAGRTVTVRYRAGGDEVVGALAVPSSIVNELDLPLTASIRSIDGEKSAFVEGPNGQKRELPLPSTWAVRKLLEKKIGQTVSVTFQRTFRDDLETATFAVRPDNIDPWQLRINYYYDPTDFRPKTELVRTSNPFKALAMGAKVASYDVVRVVQFLRGLAKRNVGVKNVAGPLGIVSFAMERAKLGFSELLFFLGFLSVNLAVLNFLPLPVLDGGLMVFLLIEKIKGKPLSLKAQMISTIVGLTTIIIIGLFVTYQDLSRIIG